MPQNTTPEQIAASLSAVGSTLDAEMRAKIANIHENQDALRQQEADLSRQTATLAKQSAQWSKLASAGEEQLKNIGDVENWAEMIEKDLLVLEETMRMVDSTVDGAADTVVDSTVDSTVDSAVDSAVVTQRNSS